MAKRSAAGQYVTPIKASDGTAVTALVSPGRYTLLANTRYFYLLPGADEKFVSAHLTGYTSGLALTTVTLQDCNHGGAEVTDFSVVAGEWPSEKPPSPPAYVTVEGTGWTVSATSVVSAAGTGLGGAMFHISETASARMRLDIQVGTTGGDLRVSSASKS